MTLYVLLILAFYPSIKNDPAVTEVMQKLPAALRSLFGEDFSTPAGYVGGRLFSLMPVLLTLFAALSGSALIAGAEARGLLEWPLAQPLPRGALLAGRALALLVMLLGLGFVLFLSTWALGQVFQAPLPAARVLQTAALHTLGAWVFGALALAVGAATGRPGLASAVGAGLGIGLVVLHTLSGQVPALQDVAWLNPWHAALAEAPLRHAVGGAPLLVCLLLGGVWVLLAAPFFQNRDVGR
ncbi:hypothetical protein DEIPH_ctg050orf0018 [Deinococcus phoenicis]|uniref:ABC transporter permease n=1 Tax=Deinococcus phoenicis TaxID=1476583 RepID=A0A016QN29_9DEIO|nr:hypothetical protein DEIPH_ctg050orf0018 [Deinococcus phoenicis]